MKCLRVINNRSIGAFIDLWLRLLKWGLCLCLWNKRYELNSDSVSHKTDAATDDSSGDETCPNANTDIRDILGRMTNVPPR